MNATLGIRPAQRTGGSATAFKPQLTSLVDVMTILLIFLLKSFSMDGNLLTPAEGLTLPGSTSREQPRSAVSVAITREAILLEGRPVVALANVDPEAADGAAAAGIAALAAELAKLAPVGDAAARPLTLQCDRDLDFRLLRRVMRTCSEAGFADFSLLVESEAA